jgi:endo-1,4-beta-D-glucanase Y
MHSRELGVVSDTAPLEKTTASPEGDGRRVRLRLLVITGILVALVVGSWSTLGHGLSSRSHPATGPLAIARRASGVGAHPAQASEDDQAFADALSFLRDYELPNGRVTRRDQGGDTVSEGQAYAMLLSVAAGDRPRFDAAWAWTRAHLLLPSGLLAWHWQGGVVTGTQPAADADVDTAYALELAAVRFAEPADRTAAAAIAAAVAHDETAPTPGGPVLVAGPWAVGPPTYVDPSYASAAELAALGAARLGGGSDALTNVANTSRALTRRILNTWVLPPDWVELDANGQPSAVSPPGVDSDGDLYGFDAVRLPIRWAASCSPEDRQLVASLWPVLGRAAATTGPTVDLRPTDAAHGGGTNSPVGLVAAAAAAWAAGHSVGALRLLDKAEARVRASPTYYASAWVALGRVELETRRLGTCGGA